ncbi:MAG TPA: response regulator [Pyrinomonadaceae bacterium]|nr:response regulator [Pyrinomonadaceae bacterium]
MEVSARLNSFPETEPAELNTDETFEWRGRGGSDERVFILAPLGQDARAMANVLTTNGFEAVIFEDSQHGAEQIIHAGALVMTEEALEFAQTENLLNVLKRQAPWSELPVIILTRGASRLAQLLDLAARAAGSVTMLERPISTNTLLRTINVALRSRRRQYQVRDLLEEQSRHQEKLKQNGEQLRLLLARERELRRVADEANRLKDEFLATLSHELRNPLNVILGYSELLLRMDNIKTSPRLLAMSEALRRNALAQSHLIRDLLELSRLRSGKLSLSSETVSLLTAINNAIETVRVDAEAKGISIVVEAPEEPMFVQGELLRLEQIVWNLLSNAVKFTTESGRVGLGLSRDNDEAVLVIEDNGQGIDPAFLPSVFEMFRQGDARASREHAGLGIGLALVQQLVKLHSGSVTAYSEGVGKGASFTVRLPVKSATWVKTASKSDVAPSYGLNRLTVLAVDDDEDTTSLLRSLLEMSGGKVITANSGKEALELAKCSDFDIVVSDISMPGMDGFELVRRLRSLPDKENVRAVALTGFGRHEDIEQARSEGFVAHLTKPLDLEALLEVLSTFAERNHP